MQEQIDFINTLSSSEALECLDGISKLGYLPTFTADMRTDGLAWEWRYGDLSAVDYEGKSGETYKSFNKAVLICLSQMLEDVAIEKPDMYNRIKKKYTFQPSKSVSQLKSEQDSEEFSEYFNQRSKSE